MYVLYVMLLCQQPHSDTDPLNQNVNKKQITEISTSLTLLGSPIQHK